MSAFALPRDSTFFLFLIYDAPMKGSIRATSKTPFGRPQ
jgi:hypothetical protein